MSPRESKTLDLALSVLRRCCDPHYRDGRTPAVQLALRVLLPYAHRADLMAFWSILENENRLQRMNNLKKVLVVIEARVMRAA